VPRDDGMSSADYVAQLTYLLFLTMADEQVRVLGKHSAIADAYSWQSLHKLDGDALEIHCRTTLTELGKGSGLIPVIFR
jgi:type I restriction enzyme M protein